MEKFCQLQRAIELSPTTSESHRLINEYFLIASVSDQVYALYFLAEKNFKRIYTLKDLRNDFVATNQIPEWLFEVSATAVGDVAETLALINASPVATTQLSLQEWLQQNYSPLKNTETTQRFELILSTWKKNNPLVDYIFNLLLVGRGLFRNTLTLLANNRANAYQQPVDIWLERLYSNWQPNDAIVTEWLTLTTNNTIHSITTTQNLSRPTQLNYQTIETISPIILTTGIQNYFISESSNGVYAQIGQLDDRGIIEIWVQGEMSLLSLQDTNLWEQWSEIWQNDLFVEGFITFWQNGNLLSQKQWIGDLIKKKGFAKLCAKGQLKFQIFDCHITDNNNHTGNTVSFLERKERLFQIIEDHKIFAGSEANHQLQKVNEIKITQWDDLATYENPVLILPHWNNEDTTRKIINFQPKAPQIFALLLYATRSPHNQYHTEFTFALPNMDNLAENLVPIGKVQSTLLLSDQKEIEAFIRDNTKERFGPMRTLNPLLVFELAYESVHFSKRHKSGIVINGLKMIQWVKHPQNHTLTPFENIKKNMIHE